MKHRRIQIGITLVASVLAIIHFIWPDFTIDAISLTLILVAILPWLAPLFKSVELPGGVKVEFQELEKAKERADNAGLLAEPTTSTTTTTATTTLPRAEYSFQSVANNDANLALAGLRIEIERRLVQIAASHGIESNQRGVGRLMQILTEKQLLTGEERSVLSDLIRLLNAAVHGATVDSRAAEWAMDVGPRLLRSLDERIQT